MSVVAAANELEAEELPEGKHIFVVLDGTGDTRIIWDPAAAAEVDNARATFERLVNQEHMVAYSVTTTGEKGEIVRRFDPEQEKLIFAPALRGG